MDNGRSPFHISKSFAILALLFYATATVGCGATVALPYAPPSFTSQRKISDDNVEVGIHVLRDPAEQNDYFGTELTEKKVLPVWISVTNKSTDKWFLIDPQEMRVGKKASPLSLSNDAGLQPDTTTAKTVGTIGAVGFAVGALLLSPGLMILALPAMLAAGSSVLVADELKRRIAANRLYVRTMFPKDTAAGFVYLQVEDVKALESEDTVLEVAIRQLPLDVEVKPAIYQIPLNIK